MTISAGAKSMLKADSIVDIPSRRCVLLEGPLPIFGILRYVHPVDVFSRVVVQIWSIISVRFLKYLEECWISRIRNGTLAGMIDVYAYGRLFIQPNLIDSGQSCLVISI